jgi:hypothetical protein
MRNKLEKCAKKPGDGKLFSNKILRPLFQPAFIGILFLFLFSAIQNAQDLPDEIRGYKVSSAKVIVKTQNDQIDTKGKSDVFVRVSEPEMGGFSLTGLTFEISAEINAQEQSGKVDFLTFKDFQVNGRSVDIEEYRNSFEFKKNQRMNLPRPIKIHLNAAQGLLGTISEIGDSKEEWAVTGRIFVFGKFKKFGMNFKRVVPVDVNIKIKNPVKNSNGIL